MKYVQCSSDSLVSEMIRVILKITENSVKIPFAKVSNDKWKMLLDILSRAVTIPNLGQTISTHTSNESA